jgi:hypothetical protein
VSLSPFATDSEEYICGFNLKKKEALAKVDTGVLVLLYWIIYQRSLEIRLAPVSRVAMKRPCTIGGGLARTILLTLSFPPLFG